MTPKDDPLTLEKLAIHATLQEVKESVDSIKDILIGDGKENIGIVHRVITLEKSYSDKETNSRWMWGAIGTALFASVGAFFTKFIGEHFK